MGVNDMNRHEAIKALRDGSRELEVATSKFKSGAMRWPQFIKVSVKVQRLRLRARAVLDQTQDRNQAS